MALTSPTGGGRSVGIVRSRTKATEFSLVIYSPFFSLQNAVRFIILTYLVPVLFTFCIQGVLKLKKKIIPTPKGLMLRTDELCAREQVMDREGWVGETTLVPVAGLLKYAEMDRYQNSMFLECKRLVSVATTSHTAAAHKLH